MRFWLSCVVFACVAVPVTARAELYRFVDKDGVWSFSNKRLDKRYHRWVVGHEKFWISEDVPQTLGEGLYDDLFIDAGRDTGIDAALLKAVAAQESGFNPRAISSKGAMGLMQLMPMTAKMLGVIDPWDPTESIGGGARYLRTLVDGFGGSLELAVAAYNCGEGPVRRNMAIPHIDETQDYVRRVMRYYSLFQQKSVPAPAP